MSFELDADISLAGCAELAGDVPFLVLNADGSIRHASRGARVLVGGRLDLDGVAVQVGESSIHEGLKPLLEQARVGQVVRFTHADGKVDAYRIHSLPVPLARPHIVLVRLDPDMIAMAGGEGLLVRPPEEYAGATEFSGMWTRASEMNSLFEVIRRVAGSDATVLIQGESGTGKERVALALHQLGKRERAPFVPVNCAALTPSLLESELFGHVKGAFTGAVRDHPGLFEQAHRGTIFLDEVAELSPDLQAKLLRVLQERSFTPVGGSTPRQVDVRVISATHQDLPRAVAEGRFREDLMFRLRVVPLFIPPLRERRVDIELLVSTFLHAAGRSGRHRFRRVHPAAMRMLLDHGWPGNVRELQNAMEYASVVGTGEALTVQDLPPEFREPRPARAVEAGPERAEADGSREEAEAIRRALEQARGNKGKAARRLGLHRTTLWRKMQRYGLG
jgi:transcriptional regulator with PAS, ATPase and Fis domain